MTGIDKIKDKLKKLFALATSSNPHEAEAALKKAESLMAYHGIETIDFSEDTRHFNIGTSTITWSRKWEITLAAGVADFWECRAIISENKIIIIGGKTDIELAADMIRRLRRIIGIMASTFQQANKDLKGTKKSITESYVFGVLDTLAMRLHTVKAARTPPPNTKALVLTKKNDTEDYVNDLFGSNLKKKNIGQKSTMQHRAYGRGRIDGEGVQLHKEVQ